LHSTKRYCHRSLAPRSLHALLYREGDRLFGDDAFCDLFDDVGRFCVPPRIVATVMALQRVEGLSDRQAVERFTYDLRWKYAAGGLDFDYPAFNHTVLVNMRARLRRSKAPDRIFEAILEVAKEAGLVGRKRVLDSTALYDAVATQDTVTLIRSAIRGLLRSLDGDLADAVRAVLKRDDNYLAAGKPMCDWEDASAREALVDALAADAYAALSYLAGREMSAEVASAVALVATVVGQDLEELPDKRYRIANGVAKDRVISTVDPDARHGHKTSARGFDGYKGHVAVDPDSEIITATEVTPGNAGDASAAKALLKDVLPAPLTAAQSVASGDAAGLAGEGNSAEAPPTEAAEVLLEDVLPAPSTAAESVASGDAGGLAGEGSSAEAPPTEAAEVLVEDVLPTPSNASESVTSEETSEAVGSVEDVEPEADAAGHCGDGSSAEAPPTQTPTVTSPPSEATASPMRSGEGVEIYGDASYGTAELVDCIESAGAEANVKVQPPSAAKGKFGKDAFAIDPAAGTVRCPADVVVSIRPLPGGGGLAKFTAHCADCPLRSNCTDSKAGRAIRVHAREATLQRSRARQQDPTWQSRYKSTRPKVERKLAHMMRHRHGGRRARVRGTERVRQDFSLLAAVTNLKRLAVLGVAYMGGTWACST